MKPPKREKIFAKKSFGQNFLVDQNYITKIVSALDPQPSETIVEIGAGRGALTERLIESNAEVVAIELERDMIAVLRERFAGEENFRLIEENALKIDFLEITKTANSNPKPKLVANLPYYISTAILQKLIGARHGFSEMVLMFQREVVERITARAGNKERGFLTVFAEAFLEIEKLFDVPPAAFRPAPKVLSAVVRLRPKSENTIADEAFFRDLLSAAFRQKRKTIFNNLKETQIADKNWGEILENAGIEPQRRAETLTLAEWIRVYQASREHGR